MRKIQSLFWNGEHKRLRLLWRLLIFFSLYALLTLLLNFLTGIILPDNSAYYLTSAGNSLLAVFFMLFLGGKFLDQRSFRDFGFHVCRQWLKDFLFGLCLGAFLMAAIFTFELAMGWIQIDSFLVNFTGGEYFVTDTLKVLVLFICIGFYEEMLMRGYLLRNLAEGLNIHQKNSIAALLLATLLSSIIFGALHGMNPNATFMSTINISIAGIFLALGFLMTGELGISIGLHIAWNFFQGPVFGFPVSGITSFSKILKIQQLGNEQITGGLFGPEAGLIGLIAMIIGLAVICLYVKITQKNIMFRDYLALYISPKTIIYKTKKQQGCYNRNNIEKLNK